MSIRYSLKNVRRTTLATILLTVAALSVTYYAYAYPFGINHTTQKDSGTPGLGQGCYCHNTQSSPNTRVSIESEETTFQPNSTYTLRVTVRNTGEQFAGFNVAAGRGTLATAETGTTLMDGELTHTTPRKLNSGAATWTFSYTTPASGTTDTIYAGGNAVNGNGTNDTGDQWNWSPKFVVHIETAGVAEASLRPAHLKLWPNPASSALHIASAAPSSSYRVIDANGRTVLTGEASSNFEVATSGLAAGSYTIETIKDGRAIERERFVVE